MRIKNQAPPPVESDAAFVSRMDQSVSYYHAYGLFDRADHGGDPVGLIRRDAERLVALARHLLATREALKCQS